MSKLIETLLSGLTKPLDLNIDINALLEEPIKDENEIETYIKVNENFQTTNTKLSEHDFNKILSFAEKYPSLSLKSKLAYTDIDTLRMIVQQDNEETILFKLGGTGREELKEIEIEALKQNVSYNKTTIGNLAKEIEELKASDFTSKKVKKLLYALEYKLKENPKILEELKEACFSPITFPTIMYVLNREEIQEYWRTELNSDTLLTRDSLMAYLKFKYKDYSCLLDFANEENTQCYSSNYRKCVDAINRTSNFIFLVLTKQTKTLDFLNRKENNFLLEEVEINNNYEQVNETVLKEVLMKKRRVTDIREELNKNNYNPTLDEISKLLFLGSGTLPIYLPIYAKLNQRIDDKVATIKELYNIKISKLNLNKDNLARKLTKPLYQLMASSKDNPYNFEDRTEFLEYLEIKDYLPINFKKTDINICFIGRSYLRMVTEVEKLKEIILKSKQLENLKNILEVSDEFLEKYKENIFKAMINGDFEIISTYYNEASVGTQRKFRAISKAYLMGKENYYRMKYFSKTDLETEVNHPISDEQWELWKENTQIQEKDFIVKEVDDFGNLMRMGQYPLRTCLHWEDGAYNRCLLSNFDTNKKLVQVLKGNKVIARALIRLTKVKDNNKVEISDEYSFVDIEKLDNGQVEEPTTEENGELVVFIEKVYKSDKYSLSEIERLISQLVIKKASGMKLQVYSRFRTEILNSNISKYMYISKSKNGYQYIDSLGGSHSASEGGSFYKGSFYITKEETEE